MGIKQTKIEDSNVSEATITHCTSSQLVNINYKANSNTLDPRSPNVCRTPINLTNKRTNANDQVDSINTSEQEQPYKENALDVLRKRFVKSFTYNLNDPRSPSINFNRTPLVFEDTLEKSLNLDDTFADLFVESCLPGDLNKVEDPKESTKNKDEQDDAEMLEQKEITGLEESKANPQTPVILQQEFDPRSPSIGVERTPIIFTDDEGDETSEDIMLESILATLSLNLNSSSNSSVVSITPQTLSEKRDQMSASKPINKHLDRVRFVKKSSPKAKEHKLKLRQPHQHIYEDQENHVPTTPKFKVSPVDKKDLLKSKRTPLSCVRNRNGTHQRSRSVESSIKNIKARLALTSFDDTLNPTENINISSLCNMQQGSHDSVEL